MTKKVEIKPEDINLDDIDPNNPNGPLGGGTGAGAGALAAATPEIKPIEIKMDNDIFKAALEPDQLIDAINKTIPLKIQGQIMNGGGR